MEDPVQILKADKMHILMKYQPCSFSQKLINPTDPSQITLTYTVLLEKLRKIKQLNPLIITK